MPRSIRRALIALTLAVLFALSGGQALAAHVDCGDTITQNTKLDSDLIDCPGDGIVIGADNITLDLNGHKIDGIGVGRGIDNDDGYDRLVVKDGRIEEFALGIWLHASSTPAFPFYDVPDGNEIERTIFQRNGEGVRAFHPAHLLLARSVLTANGTGVELIRSDTSRITNNSVTDNEGVGLGFASASTTLADGNDLEQNGVGIGLDNDVGGGFVRFERNRVIANDDGIALNDASVITASQNLIARNRGFGISVFGVTAATIKGNRVSSNGEHGITLDADPGQHLQGEDSEIVGNAVTRNGVDGISVGSGAVNTLVEGNVSSFNGDDGIEIGSTGAVAHDRANQNADLGIEAAAVVTDGGGNKASGNGNPLQCLNVFCK
jgi:nitrous oxidase accessory protein NosD